MKLERSELSIFRTSLNVDLRTVQLEIAARRNLISEGGAQRPENQQHSPRRACLRKRKSILRTHRKR